MFTTLKSKFASILVMLVAMIVVTGAVSVSSLYKLSKSLDELMIANYKSIDAMSKLTDALERQDSAMLMYVNGNRDKSVAIFDENKAIFQKWLEFEKGNITEPGESKCVEVLSSRYVNFNGLFGALRTIRDSNGGEAAAVHYEKSVMPEFLGVKELIRAITEINEKAMFEGKTRATADARNSMSYVILVAGFLALFGYFISGKLVSRFLGPIYSLTEAIKSIHAGNIEARAEVTARDETGVLVSEFNNMTSRLSLFEKSTLGQVMAEKNRTLAILKSISDPIIVMDKDFRVILVNSAFERVFGVDEERSVGKHFRDAVSREGIFDAVSAAFSEKDPGASPRTITIDSASRSDYYTLTLTRVEGRESELIGSVASFHNVTDLKNLEKIKSDFVYAISHELKTPLTSIIMGTSLLMDENLGKLGKKQLEVLETIREDGERLSDLVINLLELSRLESEKALYRFSLCSTADIFESAVKPFRQQAETRGINLVVSVEEGVPDVKVDFEKMQSVMNNLISNALKHTPQGGEVRIASMRAADGGAVVISVMDNGEGIPAEYHGRIFEKFFSVGKETSGITAGSGLGLSIAREIVAAHGGKIWFESAEGVGCTFFVELPVGW